MIGIVVWQSSASVDPKATYCIDIVHSYNSYEHTDLDLLTFHHIHVYIISIELVEINVYIKALNRLPRFFIA
jgi:hypothetical protein